MFLELTKDKALPDRDIEIEVSQFHFVNNREVKNNYPNGAEKIFLGLGCFWGAERLFWQQSNVHVTSVGYGGGFTKNPTYQDLCSGQTGHAELVQIVFDKGEDAFKQILKVFWENHDPTQGMRQGNDIGTQYRSCIYVQNEKFLKIAKSSLESYQEVLNRNNFGAEITTEICIDKDFFYAEDYHQQYLAKNPEGYCGIKGTGLEFEV